MMPKAVLPDGVLAVGAFVIPCLLCVPRRGIADIVVIFLAAASALWIGHHHAIVERYLRQHAAQRWALIIGCSCLLSLLAIGGLVKARWWVMDDHEVAELLGSDHRIEIDELVTALNQHPEVGGLGSGRRVRPAYYVLRHVESWLWGDNLAMWYLARIVLLACVFAICWSLMWRWVGGIDAGLLLLMVFCWRMWSDLWSRIGSSETYAMAGIMLGVVGLAWLHSQRVASRLKDSAAWLLIVVGAVIAMGCKENFLILVPATMGYAGWLWRQRRLDAIAALGTLAITAFGICIAWAIVGSLAAQGGIDIYAQERSLGGLLAASIRCLTADLGAVMLAVIIALAFFARRLGHDPRLAGLLPQTRATIGILTALLAMFVSQFAFYDGFNLLSNRYAFPAALAPLLMVPLLVRLRLRYRRIRGDARPAIRRTQLALRMATVLLVAGMGLTMQRHAQRHVRNTAAFTEEVNRIAEACRTSPRRPVVFVSHRPMDYESLYSVARFLRFYGAANPIYLQLQGYPGESYSRSLDAALAKELQRVSHQGDRIFRPLEQLPDDQTPLGVGFSNPPTRLACVAEFPCWK